MQSDFPAEVAEGSRGLDLQDEFHNSESKINSPVGIPKSDSISQFEILHGTSSDAAADLCLDTPLLPR